MKKDDNFIKQTALDYCLNYNIVKMIYIRYRDDMFKFYESLEDEIISK